MKRAWEEVFEEPYAPVYRKNVKGYDFVGAHWDGTAGSNWSGMHAVTPWFAEHGKSLDPSKPFFFFQHPHPKDTCYGSWAWGHDDGTATRALTPFANAVAFSGHSHYSLLDERSIWQGAFTSVGTGSLRYEGDPSDELPGGFENSGGEDKSRPNGKKLMSNVCACEQRNGLLVRVYDDAITLERRDFVRDVDLGPDWTLPLPSAEPRPFAFAEHAKKYAVPSFPEGAGAKAAVGKAKTREGKDEVSVVKVTFPSAVQTFSSRVWRYEVVVEDTTGKKLLTRQVLSPDYHLPVSRQTKEIVLPVAVSDLPAGTDVRFVVKTVNCFGRVGATLVSNSIKV